MATVVLAVAAVDDDDTARETLTLTVADASIDIEIAPLVLPGDGADGGCRRERDPDMDQPVVHSRPGSYGSELESGIRRPTHHDDSTSGHNDL